MAMRLEEDGLLVRFNRLVRPSADCEMTALPALERSLDGLNPSLWIADEAAEFKGRFLTKLLTTGSKRRESLGVIISTPGSNPENHYAELVKASEAVLQGEVEDDATVPILYGIDPNDALEDEGSWVKANPGLPFGQPDAKSLRRSWNTMKRSPAGRGEFSRYHCARADENTGGWLDMARCAGGRRGWDSTSRSRSTCRRSSWRSRSTTGAWRSRGTTGGRGRMSPSASSTTGCRSASGRTTAS
jgi:hypothetical protein